MNPEMTVWLLLGLLVLLGILLVVYAVNAVASDRLVKAQRQCIEALESRDRLQEDRHALLCSKERLMGNTIDQLRLENFALRTFVNQHFKPPGDVDPKDDPDWWKKQ